MNLSMLGEESDMAMVDLEKFICSLGMQCYCSLFDTIKFRDVQRALADQGLEYKDGKLIEIDTKELTELDKEYNRGYRQAIEDGKKWIENNALYACGFLDKFEQDMEQNLKERQL